MSYPKLTPIIAKGATEPRYLEDRFADKITPFDFGAKGDGIVNDSTAFASLEEAFTNKRVDLQGKQYKVSTIPVKNFYYNGFWIVGSDTKNAYNNSTLTRWTGVAPQGTGYNEGYFIANDSMTPEDISYDPDTDGEVPFLRDVVAIGENALKFGIENKVHLADVIAIGNHTMSSENMQSAAQHNIAIGEYALKRVTTGDRNVAVGSTALMCVTTGGKNVALGRDCGQSIVAGNYNVLLGYGANIGIGGKNLDGELDTFVNFNGEHNIIAGYRSGSHLCGSASSNIMLGMLSGNNVKNVSNNILVGSYTGNNLQSNTSYNGKVENQVNISGTYTCSENYITITCDNTATEGGDTVQLATSGRYCQVEFESGGIYEKLTTDPSLLLYVDSATTTEIILDAGRDVSSYSGGSCSIKKIERTAASTEVAADNVFVGWNCLRYTKSSKDTVAIGSRIASGTQNLEAIENSVLAGTYCCVNSISVGNTVAVGRWALGSSETISGTVSLGHGSCSSKKASTDDVAIGRNSFSLKVTTSSQRNTAVGFLAMDALVDGTETVSSIENATAIGYHARVSGSNQVQLGNASTTTYAYGSVQDRSDVRDKADIRDTILGLDFIKSLHPVDFKWDYRDDYIEIVEDKENGDTSIIKHEKDGSQKRNRYHHGLIAQEVKAVLDEKGIDFGGYQDHKINGGADVLTLGYEEFIGPIIKAIQELNEKVEQLEERINQLTNPIN